MFNLVVLQRQERGKRCRRKRMWRRKWWIYLKTFSYLIKLNCEYIRSISQLMILEGVLCIWIVCGCLRISPFHSIDHFWWILQFNFQGGVLIWIEMATEVAADNGKQRCNFKDAYELLCYSAVLVEEWQEQLFVLQAISFPYILAICWKENSSFRLHQSLLCRTPCNFNALRRNFIKISISEHIQSAHKTWKYSIDSKRNSCIHCHSIPALDVLVSCSLPSHQS